MIASARRTWAVRGVQHLLDTNAATGGRTGTRFSAHFYLPYPMYRDYFPLMAPRQWR